MLLLNLLILALAAYLYPQLRSALSSTDTAMSQKALLLHEAGTPLVAGYRPIPQPGENQLLVKVLVAGRKSTNVCSSGKVVRKLIDVQ